jgi:phosphatidylglycerol:prolipoprotein diacylglycerol transferase
MYLCAFSTAWALASYRAKHHKDWTAEMISDLVFFVAMGVIIGGRAGYVLFYNFDQFLGDPVWLFKVWTGGMSFHGGLLGVLIAFAWFAKKYNKTFFDVADFSAPVVPIGLMYGRIGNFIGSELWGRTSDVPWAMVFPNGGDEARHPSQLYQAGLEGLALFIIIWIYSSKPRPAKAVSGCFLLGYGIFRFIVEFFRQPDNHIGFDLFGWLSRGQLLSMPMILIGVMFIVMAYRHKSVKKGTS